MIIILPGKTANMKMLTKICLLLVLMLCCCGASPCWVKHQPTYISPIVPQAYTVYGYQLGYVPYIVQERRLVPVIENRIEYKPVVSQFFMNYNHYYFATPQYYVYPYYPYGVHSNGWSGYNY